MLGFRNELGIPAEALVVGLAGSLHWNERVDYGYGASSSRRSAMCRRRDVVICLVGDGSGRERLEEMAGDGLGVRVLLPGRVAPELVPDYLAAFDIGSLSQSVDGVGSFRYTTKLSEYLASELPVIVGEIPAAYDLDEGYMWRLPGAAPWSATQIGALEELLEGLDPADIAEKREAISRRAGRTVSTGPSSSAESAPSSPICLPASPAPELRSALPAPAGRGPIRPRPSRRRPG